jgi:DNA polymerase-3 subunit beta
MKFRIDQGSFSKTLSLLNHVVPLRPNLPVIANILIWTNREKLYLSATNLEFALTLVLPAKIEKEGKITFPARITSEFVSSLLNRELGVELKDKLLEINQGKIKASFSTIPPEEFPSIPQIEEKPSFSVDKDIFSLALEKVVFAAAQDEGRPTLTGVLWESQNDALRMVATDGYRLSFVKLPLGKKTESLKIIVPSKTLTEVLRICQEGEEKEKEMEIYWQAQENQIGFGLGEKRLVSRLIEGQFPDWERIVPEDFKIKTVLEKEELLRNLKTASIFARESGGVVKCIITPKSFTFQATTAQIGENECTFPAKTQGQVGGEIAFNYRYLLDILAVVKEEEVSFGMIESLNPAIFRPVGKEGENFFHIVMPVRVQD